MCVVALERCCSPGEFLHGMDPPRVPAAKAKLALGMVKHAPSSTHLGSSRERWLELLAGAVLPSLGSLLPLSELAERGEGSEPWHQTPGADLCKKLRAKAGHRGAWATPGMIL